MKGLALATLFVAACHGSRAPQQFAVTVHGMTFDPPELHVHPGDTIVWTNADLVPHTVTAAGGAFNGAVDPAASWTLTAPARGTYAYACTLHPMMKATLVVE